MTIYFTASISKKHIYLDEYMRIITHLTFRGHTVLSNHIIHGSEEAIHHASREDLLAFQYKVEHWIKDCDFVVADTSHPSVSVGYEIALALRMGKPVLVFYGDSGAPSLLQHYKDERLATERFVNDSYRDVLDEFASFAASKSDIRFTFFITPEINAHMDEIVLREKMPKAVYIRTLIEKDIQSKKD